MATTPKKKPPAKKKAPAKKAPAKKAPVKKAPSGTLTERMGEVKSRPNKGLPAKIERPRGNLNRANPPKEIKLKGEGGTGRSLTRGKPPTNFKPVPLSDRPKLLGNASSVAKTGARIGLTRASQMVAGPVGFLVGMTTEVGRGSDAPPKYGKTLKEQAEQRKKQAFGTGGGNPKTVNPVRVSKARVPARGEARGGMKSTLESYRASKVTKSSVSMTGGGVNKPESKSATPKPKVRPVAPSVAAPKPKARPAMEKKYGGMTFQEASRRNMQAEYERAKRKPKGTLLGLLRR